LFSFLSLRQDGAAVNPESSLDFWTHPDDFLVPTEPTMPAPHHFFQERASSLFQED